jgi:integrase
MALTPQQKDARKAAREAFKHGAEPDALREILAPAYGDDATKTARAIVKESAAAKLEKTRTPGIFKRGSRYVFSYRVEGKQRWESCRTLEEARRAKSARSTDIERGEFEQRSRVTLREYAEPWIERYLGRGRGGFREGTRDEYRRQLDTYIYPHFGTAKLTEITPSRVAGFVGWLCKQTTPAPTEGDKDRRVPLSDATVRNIMAPLRACLSSAVREGLIRSNPAREADLPHRPTAEDSEDEEVKAMSEEELTTLLELIPARHRLLFRLLAATGMRISEAIALQWRHLELDGSTPHLKVRRALVKGRMGPPKSRYGRRSVPLDSEMVGALRRARKDTDWPGGDDLVFPAGNGSPLDQGNLYRDALTPAREEADLTWVGFKTFRHTCASMLFAKGRNAKQVQRWLGHHSPAFTMATYVHLLDGDIGEALSIPQGVNKVQTCPTPISDTRPVEGEGDSAVLSQTPDSATLSDTPVSQS